MALITRPRGRRVVNLRILPSSMSVLAICAGLTSIRFALEGQPHVAIALIAAAAILDGLDGRVARALDAESRRSHPADQGGKNLVAPEKAQRFLAHGAGLSPRRLITATVTCILSQVWR